MKNRLDILLATSGMAKSRSAAQQMIKEGSVTVNGVTALKSSEIYDDEKDEITVSADSAVMRYAGRGGLKLETAIDAFGIDLGGAVCLDIGASTGGFTDCMLQHGAARVYAVDVGRSQLAEKLRNDERVISLEELDIRSATEDDIPEKVGFVSVDVSFISLKMILPEIKRFAAGNCRCCALIKPQFELGKKHIGKSGVVKDPKLHEKAVADITSFAAALGFRDIKTVPSKIAGGDGNREFLMYSEVDNIQ